MNKIGMLEKLVIEIVLSLRGVELSPEHKHFINMNYEQALSIINELRKENSYEENDSE